MQIKIREKIASNLYLREAANRLFDSIEKRKSSEIVFDFEGIQFMSRSFAHQYLTRKAKTKKKIVEIHFSPNLQRMLDIIAEPNVIRTKAAHRGIVKEIVI